MGKMVSLTNNRTPQSYRVRAHFTRHNAFQWSPAHSVPGTIGRRGSMRTVRNVRCVKCPGPSISSNPLETTGSSERKDPTRGGATSRAKRVCAECPVRAACLDHALTYNEQHGIWGGKTPRERQELQLTTAIESGPTLQQQQARTIATLSAQNVPAESIASQLGITTRQVYRIRSRTA